MKKIRVGDPNNLDTIPKFDNLLFKKFKRK